MAFVDPEKTAAALDAMKARADAMLGMGGPEAASARAHPAFEALFLWLRSEIEAGTAYPDMIEAAGRVTGAFLASAAMNAAVPGQETGVLMLGLRTALQQGMAALEEGPEHLIPVLPGQRQ